MSTKAELRRQAKDRQREAAAERRSYAREQATRRHEANQAALSCLMSFPPRHVWEHGTCLNCGRRREDANVERGLFYGSLTTVAVFIAMLFMHVPAAAYLGALGFGFFVFAVTWFKGALKL